MVKILFWDWIIISGGFFVYLIILSCMYINIVVLRYLIKFKNLITHYVVIIKVTGVILI